LGTRTSSGKKQIPESLESTMHLHHAVDMTAPRCGRFDPAASRSGGILIPCETIVLKN